MKNPLVTKHSTKDESPHIKTLASMGFSKAESLIYVHLLERGTETGVSKIALGTGMHRQQVYMAIPSLVAEGLVEETKMGKISKFKARPPQILERIARRKIGMAEDLAQELQKISKVGHEQDFEVIVGTKRCQEYEVERAKNMREGEEQYIIGTEKDEYLEIMGDVYASEYVPILAKKNIVTYYLAPEVQASRGATIDERQQFKLRVLKNLTTGPLATMIQGDNLIFYVNVHPATIYVIRSKKVAEGYKQFFQMLWNMAK